LLAWLYFVRPIGSVVVIAVSVFLFVEWQVKQQRARQPLLFAATGGLWLAAFVIYSWSHFRMLLPSYYQANRLRFDLLPLALTGNLLSPSRGFVVYVPAVLFVIYLVVRYWKELPFKNLVWLSLSICALHLFFVSAFANLWGDWWGGASFGPRYSTELVPWLVLLGVLAIKARQDALGSR